MGRVELNICYLDGATEKIRAVANKWKFQDTMMGEQFITLTITSETPIPWAVGDYCVFRGQTYTLNYIPSVTQKGRTGEIGDAYTYEGVKFDSRQEELTRCMMLDITPTTGDYIAALGTNYTGSSRFQLFCGETIVEIDGELVTLTPVCALAAKMQANLDRLYPTLGWHIYVNTETTYTTSTGAEVLVTHTDEKLLSFDNTTVAQALAEVHNTFDLDYCIKGRSIYIGYTLGGLTSDDEEEIFAFGYGHGYPQLGDPGKGLFQIKQISNSQQKLVTRLRALGSTKNMPYRHYNKKYDLSQSLFPTNLQLPGTFLPEGNPSDTASATGTTKWALNNARDNNLAAVLGDTNDAYIDKNNDAEGCVEGVREDCARWDGSNGDLPEIYPTIEGMTFGDLRNALVPDQTNTTGSSAYQGDSVQPNTERIDQLLAVGYTENGTLIDDANKGDGIMPEENSTASATVYPAVISQKIFNYQASQHGSDLVTEGEETELFTVHDVAPGTYFMVPTGPSYESVVYSYRLSSSSAIADIGFVIRVYQRVAGSTSSVIATYDSTPNTTSDTSVHEDFLPELPDVKNSPNEQVSSITVTQQCDVVVTFAPTISSASGGDFTLSYQVGKSQVNSADYDPEYNWGSTDDYAAVGDTFHVFIKDVGFNLAATFTGDTPVVAMKSGACVGREFTIGDNVVAATVNGKRGYLLTLTRATDSNLNTYYPSASDPIAAGDYFVLLGISMPDAYIKMAEARLLQAATDYLADNCETKYTYQPSIDDIYLQRNYDKMVAAGTPEDSIFWRLYAGLKFLFRGIPSSANSPLPLIDITIEQVSIQMGDGLTPKVEIVLNDDIQQSTLQKLTTAVDRIYNGSAYGGKGVGASALYEILTTDGGRMFLSKIKDDTANGKITFKDVITAQELIKSKGGIVFGDYMPGFLGAGGKVDEEGKAEFERVDIRGALHAAELVFNQISAEEGESIRSIGHGEILTVTQTSVIAGTATLKLDGDEWATIDVGDICRGLYNTIEKDYDNSGARAEGEDSNGFRKKKGFFASYFKVTSVTSSKGECSFTYEVQNSSGIPMTEHPCELMKFAVYGNVDGNKPERQSCMYISAVGIAPRMLFLAGVDDWKIKPENIKIALGNVNGVKVWEEVTETEYSEAPGTEGTDKYITTETVDGETVYHYIVLKELFGVAGLYCEDNIYLGGIIDQFKNAAWDAISANVSNLGQAWVWTDQDSFIVDCDEFGTVLATENIAINAKLYYGNQLCTITQAIFSGFNQSYVVPAADLLGGGTIAPYSRQITVTTEDFSSQVLSIRITGTATINGTATTFEAMKTVTIFANRQGRVGDDGDGAAWIDAMPDSLSVECDKDGKVSPQQSVTIGAKLLVGNTRKNISSKSATYDAGQGSYSPTISQTTGQNGYERWTVVFPANNTPLAASSIKISLSGGGYTATKTIAVIPARQGEQGIGKAGYSAQLTKASDNIVIDNNDNIIGGFIDRLYTSVNIWEPAENRQLTYQSGSGTLADGKYMLSIEETNCTASIDEDGEISITDITDKSLNGCSVKITAITYEAVEFQFVYSVTFTHLDQSYLTFTLDNEYDAMSYRTQTSRYDGLPITATMKVYANDVENTEDGVTYGNVRIYSDTSIGYINKVIVSSDLLEEDVAAFTIVAAQNAISFNTTTQDLGNSGLQLKVKSDGTVTIEHKARTKEIDLEDAKHWFDIKCEVIYGGVTYVSPPKRLTIGEATDSTIYRLMLSATAISQEESTYTPASIDVQVSIADGSGVKIYDIDGEGRLVSSDGSGGTYAPNQNVRVRYIGGLYDPYGENVLLTTCPQFSSLSEKVFTVVVAELVENESPVFLDIQSVTINKGGKDGAGQSWINASHDQFIVDCDVNGVPLSPKALTITASLRWGDETCYIGSTSASQMSYSTTSGATPSSTSVSWDDGGEHYRIKKTFRFLTTNSYNSGLVTITLAGTTTANGVTQTHTATKTVSVIMNRQGSTGSVGRSIVSATTYYLRCIEFSGVEAPATNIDPGNEGWVTNYIQPTQEEPYLWRFTRTIYSLEPLIEQTDAELVGKYSGTPNYNLLDDTVLLNANHMDAWTSYWYRSGSATKWSSSSSDGGVEYKSRITIDNSANVDFSFGIDTTELCDGYNSYKARVTAVSTITPSGLTYPYALILRQLAYRYDVVARIETNKWYTISFWHKGDTIHLQNHCLNTNKEVFKDGVAVTSNEDIEFSESSTWQYHTLTFCSRTTFGNNTDYQIEWRMPIENGVEKTAWISKPKLEVGKIATDYLPSMSEQKPVPLRTKWAIGEQFLSGALGERYFHLVNDERRWYRCIRSHISDTSNRPSAAEDTLYWQRADNIPFLASGLILADEGVIDLLYSNTIYMYGEGGEKISSINADGKGSYCCYYLNGRKRMEFSADGYIIYYNNNEANSPKWTLGYGGSIETAVMDRLETISLHKFDVTETSVIINIGEFNEPTDSLDFDQIGSAMQSYLQVKAAPNGNWGAYNNYIYKYKSGSFNPATDTRADNGYYTPNQFPYQYLEPYDQPRLMASPGTTSARVVYAYTVYKLENGKIVRTFEVRSDDEAFNN